MEKDRKAFEEKIQRRKQMFSIFYGKLLEKAPSIALVDEIGAKTEEIRLMCLNESKAISTLTKLAVQTGKEADLIHLSNMQKLFDSFTEGCETQIELLVTMIGEIEIKLRPSENTRSKTDFTEVPVAAVIKGAGPAIPSRPKIKVLPPKARVLPPNPVPRAASKPNVVVVREPKPKPQPAPPQRPTLVIPSPPPKQITPLEGLRTKFCNFIEILNGFYIPMVFKKNDFVLVDETVDVKGNKILIHTSDVRGDGACGFRAILTSFLLRSVGKHLPYDPIGMSNFILELKNCMHDLMRILEQNSENREFIIGLLRNPDNDRKNANIDKWFEMISDNGYNCTDGEIRLVAILFGLLPEADRFAQINVLKLRPTEHNIYQSFNCYGTPEIVLPCSESHINIIHTGGHFRSVSGFTGRLPPILSIDANIILPSA